MKQQVLRTLVVLALAVAAVRLLHNLITPVLWAGVIAIATWPLQRRFVARHGERAQTWIALVLTVAVVGVFLMPFGYVVFRGWLDVHKRSSAGTSCQPRNTT